MSFLSSLPGTGRAKNEARAADHDAVSRTARRMAGEALDRGDERGYWRHWDESAFASEAARLTRSHGSPKPRRWVL